MPSFSSLGGIQSIGTTGSLILTVSQSVSTGDLICVGCSIYQVGTQHVTDSLGNTYTQLVLRTSANDTVVIFYTISTTTGTLTDITLVHDSENKYCAMGALLALGYSNTTLNNSLEGVSTGPHSNAVTPSNNNALLVGVLTAGGSGYLSQTPGTGFSTIYDQPSASSEPVCVIAKIQSTAGAEEASWTTALCVWVTCVGSFEVGSTPTVSYTLWNCRRLRHPNLRR